MSNMYLKLAGKFTAATIGSLDRYSEEHKKFLSSGYICSHCSRTLMNWWGGANVNCYAANGEKVPLMKVRRQGEYFECPKCQHQWRFRANKQRFRSAFASEDPSTSTPTTQLEIESPSAGFCPQCGHARSGPHKFCPYCGHALTIDDGYTTREIKIKAKWFDPNKAEINRTLREYIQNGWVYLYKYHEGNLVTLILGLLAFFEGVELVTSTVLVLGKPNSPTGYTRHNYPYVVASDEHPSDKREHTYTISSADGQKVALVRFVRDKKRTGTDLCVAISDTGGNTLFEIYKMDKEVIFFKGQRNSRIGAIPLDRDPSFVVRNQQQQAVLTLSQIKRAGIAFTIPKGEIRITKDREIFRLGSLRRLPDDMEDLIFATAIYNIDVMPEWVNSL